jgi:hypothetical protein
MFLESFNRRFAESVDSSNLREYKIKIIDFNETPPKVSVEVTTVTAASVKGEGVSVVNRVDGIIETIYDDYVYSRGYYQMLVNPKPTPTPEIVPVETPEPTPTSKPDNVIMDTPYQAKYGCYGNANCYCWGYEDKTNYNKSYTIDTNSYSKVVIQVSGVGLKEGDDCGPNCAWAGRCNTQFGVYIGDKFQPIQQWSYDAGESPKVDGVNGYLAKTSSAGTITINLANLGMTNKGNQTLKFGFLHNGGGYESTLHGWFTINKITLSD